MLASWSVHHWIDGGLMTRRQLTAATELYEAHIAHGKLFRLSLWNDLVEREEVNRRCGKAALEYRLAFGGRETSPLPVILADTDFEKFLSECRLYENVIYGPLIYG
jgi:hypothetical protein